MHLPHLASSEGILEKMEKVVRHPFENSLYKFAFLLRMQDELVEMPESGWRVVKEKFGNYLGQSFVKTVQTKRETEQAIAQFWMKGK